MSKAISSQPVVASPADFTTEITSFGRLVWQVSEDLGTSDALTVGRCLIEPGHRNPRHFHPNCSEVLQVLRGAIRHTWNEHEVIMLVGDVISIPPGVVHNAENVGDETAELLICFSAGRRLTVPEHNTELTSYSHD
jgi:quercetin dioxygenase-like cupin family protein